MREEVKHQKAVEGQASPPKAPDTVSGSAGEDSILKYFSQDQEPTGHTASLPPKATQARKHAAKNGTAAHPPHPREPSPDDIKDLSLSAISVDMGKGNGADDVQAAFAAK